MTEITLKVRSARGTQLVPIDGSCVTIGRGQDAGLCIDDQGLSRRHASINTDGQRVWLLDEQSANGSFVNGKPVPPDGMPLKDGDEISIGSETAIIVNIVSANQGRKSDARRDLLRPVFIGIPLFVGAALLAAFAVSRLWGFAGNETGNYNRQTSKSSSAESASGNAPAESAAAPSAPSPVEAFQPVPPLLPAAPAVPGNRILYRDMGDEDRMEYIERQARAITTRMSNSNHPEIFDEFVVRKIKSEVDEYVRGRGKTGLWGVELKVIFDRAAPYAPYISRCFNQENVPPIVGLYIVWIETSYVNVAHENHASAMGLFQFIPETARSYGIANPAERTNVQKMAPAAARYMRDRISRFGGDTKGVALAIANYNRGGTPRDLREVIDKENPDRSFWTLMANREKLNLFFQQENVHYVPRFFAAAIIGENPWDFGVSSKPLSAL